MFCPTAVDDFFIQKLSSLDISLSKRSLNESTFQDRVTFGERFKEAEQAKRRYPKKIPMVIEKHRTEKNLQDIDKVSKIEMQSWTLSLRCH